LRSTHRPENTSDEQRNVKKNTPHYNSLEDAEDGARIRLRARLTAGRSIDVFHFPRDKSEFCVTFAPLMEVVWEFRFNCLLQQFCIPFRPLLRAVWEPRFDILRPQFLIILQRQILSLPPSPSFHSATAPCDFRNAHFRRY
jgi:hypothetical protein